MAKLLLPQSISTDRLLLRPCKSEDAEGLTKAVSESRGQLDPWMPWSRFYDDPAAASVYIETAQASWRNGDELPLLITDRISGEILGGSGFHHIHWDRGTFATGYWVRTSAIGQGIARETTRALTRLVFERFQGTRIWITCDSRNERSRQIPEALGFRQEACCRNDSRATDGSLRDTLVYGMMVDEFPGAVQTWPVERFELALSEIDTPTESANDDEDTASEQGVDFPRPLLIESPRLLLRRPEITDAPELFALVERSRAHFQPWFRWTRRVQSIADAESICVLTDQRWRERSAYELLAFDRETGAMVGGGNVHAFRWEVPAVEIDWWLDAAQTGKGFATEIGGALLRFVMETWVANRAEIWVQDSNAASRAVGKRLGFTEEGIIRFDHPDADGRPANWAISSVIPSEFHDLKDRLPVIRVEVD
jgi:RimJ/RimL family protein N-acetyltransferase